MEAILSVLKIGGAALFVVFFFGMCVFVHELGHFLVAKWRGLYIVAFSLGFKKAWGKKINNVEYRIGWIPAGGYVDLPQIDTTEIAKDSEGNVLPPAKPLDRLLTAVAGPVANILFGLLLGVVIWVVGIPQDSAVCRSIVVDELIVDSPEYRAGLRPGDEIIKLNGKSFNYNWKQFTKQILFNIGKVNLEVIRGNEVINIEYTPEPNPFVAEEMRKESLAMPFFTPYIPLRVSTRPNAPAALAGINNGDILRTANGLRIDDLIHLNYLLAKSKGSPVVLEVENELGSRSKLEVKPGKIAEIYQRETEPIPLCGVYLIEGEKDNPNAAASSIKIALVERYSPAWEAGLKANDHITEVNGNALESAAEFHRIVKESKGNALQVKILSGSEAKSVTLTPAMVGVFGIGVTNYTYLSHPNPFAQFFEVVDMTVNSFKSIGYNLARKVNLTENSSNVSIKNLSGPSGIAVYMYKAVYHSIITGVYIVAFISFALALTNLLPLPVLDGGHILFAGIELIFRRPVPRFIIKHLSGIFVVILIGAMVGTTLLDIFRFIPAKPMKTMPVIISIEHPEVPGDGAQNE